MTTLQEQRMVSYHQMGRRDYQDGRPMTVPVYANEEERTAYVAGYRGEERRSNGGRL